MTLRSFTITLLLAAPVAACYAAPLAKRKVAAVEKPAPAPVETPPAPEPTPVEELLVEADPSCPMSVPGTTVAYVETDTGAALMFETHEVGDVETRLAAIAFEHNKASWRGDGDAVHASGGVTTIPEPARLPLISTPSKASVEASSTGVRLSFAAEPGQIDRLRAEVSQQAIALAGGRCSEAR